MWRRLKKVEKTAMPELQCSVYSTFNTTDGTAAPLVAAAAPRRLVNVAQGDNVTDRQGNRLKAVKLDYRAIIQNTDAASQAVRFIFFYWNSDTAPTTNDVILAPVAASGVPNTTLQNINEISIANGHLKIMKDVLIFPTANASGNGASTRVLKFKRKCGRYIEYNDTAAANMTKGYYYLVFATDVDVTIQDGINFYYRDP